MSDKPHVTVAGGGLAGITAALRLADRGYAVTLYEQRSWLGGDLASRPGPDGIELDVYPHMYLSWYHNFWGLLRDFTPVDREDAFIPLTGVKQLRRGEYPKYSGVTDMYSPWHMVQNLFSGVGPVADMFVFGYSSIDLLAEKLDPTIMLDDVSVTGFLHARPYMTERAADACDNFITMVWAIPSYLAAAEDYRSYLAYSFAEHDPAYWLASDSAFQQVIGPLTRALEDRNVEIVRERQVTSVSCRDGRVTEIALESVEGQRASNTWRGLGDESRKPVEELVLAVPPEALSTLVRTSAEGFDAVVRAAPRIAEVARLRTQRIPILHLYFTKKLRHIPPEPVGLFGSSLALAFTDISQTWPDRAELGRETVLSLSASDPYGLPGTSPHDDAMAMLRELRNYLEFDLGSQWGQSDDIDWERTRYEPNTDVQLSVNETGTEIWRPRAACDGVENLTFAGDFCHNDVGMMTIESAVTTGLEAASVVVARHGGPPVEIVQPDAGLTALYVWLRYAWGPYAMAAKAVSKGQDCLGTVRRLLSPGRAPGRQRRDS